MINDVEQIQSLLLEESKQFDDPIAKRRFFMTSPGCSHKRIIELKKVLPGIPDSYTKWIESINLNGVSLGYFELSPSAANSTDIVGNIIDANDTTMFRNLMEKHGLYLIATTDYYGIFVANGSSKYDEGEIVIIDEEIFSNLDRPRENNIQTLAKDFKEFLLGIANLYQIRGELIKSDLNKEQKKTEFIERLKILGVDEKYHQAWMSVF